MMKYFKIMMGTSSGGGLDRARRAREERVREDDRRIGEKD